MDLKNIFKKPFSNWKVLLLSFLGASTFWFFSALGKQYNTRIKHPLDFVFDQDSLVLMKPLAEYVELDVTGGGWDLFRQGFWFNADPIIIEPDNPVSINFLTRPTIFPIVTDKLNQFQINFLYTDTLYIDIERKVSKQILLKVDSSAISLDNNYRITSPIQISPDTVEVVGPTSFIDSLTSNWVLPISFQEIDKSFDRFVPLVLPEGFSISSAPSTVNVKFEVERFDQLQMPVQLELLNFPEDSTALPKATDVNVKFTMQRSLREDFFAEDFKVILDYDMIQKSDSMAPAILMIYPENALEVEVEPDSIKIDYRE